MCAMLCNMNRKSQCCKARINKIDSVTLNMAPGWAGGNPMGSVFWAGDYNFLKVIAALVATSVISKHNLYFAMFTYLFHWSRGGWLH